jgi:hypothetical protein
MESSCSTANAIPTPDANSTAAVAPKPKQRVAGKGKGKAVVQTSILAVPDNSYEASVTPTGASEMPATILKKGRKRTAADGVDQPAAPTKKKRKIENLAPAEGGTLIAGRPEEPGSSQVSTTTTKRPRPRPVKKGTGNQGGLTDPLPNANMLQDSPQESSVDDRSTPMMVDAAKSTNANPTTAPIVAEVGTKLAAKARGRNRKTVPDVAVPEDPALLPKKANKRLANALTLGSRRSSRLASQVTEAASSNSIQLATTSEPIGANSTTGQPTTVQPAAGGIALPHANQGDM